MAIKNIEENDFDFETNNAPDIDCQYNVYWQQNGSIFCENFTVFEGEDEHRIFAKACVFAKGHDTLVFYVEPCPAFYNPNTGEELNPPINCGKDYYAQPPSPKELHGFTAIETDELPF